MTPEDSVPRDEGTMHLKWQPQDAPSPEERTVRLGGATPAEPQAYVPTVKFSEPDATLVTPIAAEPELIAAPAAEPAAMPEAAAAAAAGASDPGLIRFGPGVPDPKTARTIAVWKGEAAPAAEKAAEGARKRNRLWWIPVVLLALALLGWYLWRSQAGSALELQGASINVTPTSVSCNGTATITATVATNGDSGSFQYHWVRSDGTDSGMLTESVVAGTRQVELPLVWKVSGPGQFHGTATLVLPGHPTIKPTISFDYSCSG
jgi:hypothetical protein